MSLSFKGQKHVFVCLSVIEFYCLYITYAHVKVHTYLCESIHILYVYDKSGIQ